jgi:hypothetical protein
MEKERNRNLMIYELNVDIQRQQPQELYVCRIEGAGTIKDSTCRRWFAKFLNEKEGLKDKNRSGRKSPSSIVVELSFWDKDGWKPLPITANI